MANSFWNRIEHVRGDTYELYDVTFVEDDQVTPIDLTGASIAMTIRDKRNDQVVCLCSVGDGITITDEAGGVFDLLIDPDKTANVIIPTRDDRLICSYDIQVITNAGKIKTPALGDFVIFRDNTRSN